ncbi:MarR family winged helix-turn-helix transcriptional regulator [Agrobacterium sp. ES01]|uniref:MarR family winged helix-turn-helix transcriptional regulator n=1 Tax=Agrobacterium sp. ES01 TaxID=3420714 RepID=UPI003D0D8C0F
MFADAVGYRLRRAHLSVMQNFNETLAAKGLRPADFALLMLLTKNSGLKQSEVAQALGVQRANFVAIVDGLEQRGFVERRKSEVDRRVQSLYLTPEGFAYLDEIRPVWQGYEQRITELLGGPEASAELCALLGRLYTEG